MLATNMRYDYGSDHIDHYNPDQRTWPSWLWFQLWQWPRAENFDVRAVLYEGIRHIPQRQICARLACRIFSATVFVILPSAVHSEARDALRIDWKLLEELHIECEVVRWAEGELIMFLRKLRVRDCPGFWSLIVRASREGVYISPQPWKGGGFSVHANANYCFFQQWQRVFAKDLGRGDNKSKWSNSVWQRGDLKTNYWLSMMTIKRWSNVGMEMQKRMIRSPWVSRRVIPRLENIERFGRLGGGFMLNTNCQVSRWHLSSNIDRSTVGRLEEEQTYNIYTVARYLIPNNTKS